jgi:hypothetical protein
MFSQGFRPGGFHENGDTKHIYGTDGVYQYVLGRSWQSDKLKHLRYISTVPPRIANAGMVGAALPAVGRKPRARLSHF